MSIIDFDNHFIAVIKSVFENAYDYKEDLDQLHNLLTTDKIPTAELVYQSKTQILGKNDRESIFIKKFHEYVDKNETPNFTKTYEDFIRQYVLPRFPKETKLVIQKTPNIRFSFPSHAAIGSNPLDSEGNPIDPDGIIGLHKDADFGHHYTEQNFIIPVTDMFDTNSLYYNPSINKTEQNEIPDTNKSKDKKKFINLELKNNKFFTGYFNQWPHYNKINQTGKTRISFDLRVIPYSSYESNEDYFVGTKFELNKGYYILFE